MEASRLIFILKILPLYGLTTIAFTFPYFYNSLLTKRTITSNNLRIVQAAQNTVIQPEISALPVNIALPRLGINLKVNDGHYDSRTRQWTLSMDKVYYAADATSALSNKKSNTLIYGHVTADLLKPTKNLVKGDQLLIKGDNGKLFEYYYANDDYANPTDTNILNLPAGKPEVRLMTCDGTFFQYRRIMTFRLLKVS